MLNSCFDWIPSALSIPHAFYRLLQKDSESPKRLSGIVIVAEWANTKDYTSEGRYLAKKNHPEVTFCNDYRSKSFYLCRTRRRQPYPNMPRAPMLKRARVLGSGIGATKFICMPLKPWNVQLWSGIPVNLIPDTMRCAKFSTQVRKDTKLICGGWEDIGPGAV